MSAGDAVEPRVRSATERFFAAQQEFHNSLAEQCRLELIEYIDKNNADPEAQQIEGLTFETEYEYDDEGGYFMNDTVYPIVNDFSVTDELYDFGDFFQAYGHEPLCILCGVGTDAFSGSVTIEQARERRF